MIKPGDTMIEQHLKRTSSGWSIGVFGAIASGWAADAEQIAFETLATCTRDWSFGHLVI